MNKLTLLLVLINIYIYSNKHKLIITIVQSGWKKKKKLIYNEK